MRLAPGQQLQTFVALSPKESTASSSAFRSCLTLESARLCAAWRAQQELND